MSLRRRLEIIGGPARPFSLTVREADLLRSACEAYIEECHRTNAEIPPEDESDREADAGVIQTLDRLHDRLLIHSGYTPESIAAARARRQARRAGGSS